MIPALRERFNREYTPEKYRAFLAALDTACGTHVKFRVCETPCFFPRALVERLAAAGREMVHQLVTDPVYREASRAAIPPQFNVPGESPRPLFVQADFGLVRGAGGEIEPRLVEIQGFPSLYAYQTLLLDAYRRSYALDLSLGGYLDFPDSDSYLRELRRAIMGGHDPENVVLLEIHPWEQKTLPDFTATEKLLGVRPVCITEVKKEGRQLFYAHEGKRIPIRRIYNRVIVDELVRKDLKLPFSFTDDLDVEWAGHPNWFFRISKFSIPFLKHPAVPRAWFLDQMDKWPADLENYVLKPLFSFAGLGVIVGPTRAELDAIPPEKRHEYLFQERMRFEPVIATPHGATQAELRIMFLWVDELKAGPVIVRMGRGKMMGVDHNRDLEWVGASAAFLQ
ncbi:MAG TPA: hypothetical protein VEG63_02270 [Candidatus Acidoferrales bacterium]|nr:hypothetical protein [Candidatus Acidoferrales bacterium]